MHLASPRANKPFVALNCAAIPKDLIESEIFGHLKGAFTGAIANREGAAGQADGGTLFFNFVRWISTTKQTAFIQAGCYQQVGSEKEVKVDVPSFALPIETVLEVQEGRFREDLYYRLHVIPIALPPLKQQGKDVIEIADALFKKISKRKGQYKGMSEGVKNLFLGYSWPGNVRQLENTIRNIMVLHDESYIEVDMIPALLNPLIRIN